MVFAFERGARRSVRSGWSPFASVSDAAVDGYILAIGNPMATDEKIRPDRRG